MKQNIYDNPDFFKGYMDLRSSEKGFNAAVEEPAIRSLLPSLKGLRILDLGCGFGKFTGFCLTQGAAYVLGTDISQKMISLAEQKIRDPRAGFQVTAVEDFKADKQSFDLVVSSMCFHYVKNIGPVFKKIALVLKDKGNFIFSVEHPICTSLLNGWCGSDKGTKSHWPVDNYKEESMRISNWFVDGVIKYHRTIETYINEFIDAGFVVKRLLEPGPTNSSLTQNPELFDHLRRPPVLVLAGSKR